MPPMRNVRGQLLDMFRVALAAVDGASRVNAFLRAHPLSGRVHIIAIGKAACSMVRGAVDTLGAQIGNAWVVTKHGHAEALPWPVLEAGHPLPDQISIDAGVDLLEYIRLLPADAHVLVLLSGGASTLVECPVRGIGLDELRVANEWLLATGLEIGEMNAVRRRLSRIKGGGLAGLLAPRQVTGLAISDVPGDDVATIASGPLVYCRTPRPPLPAHMPAALCAAIQGAGDAGQPELSAFERVRTHVIATSGDAVRAAAEAARGFGYRSVPYVSGLAGNAVESGYRVAGMLLDAPVETLHVWGGETWVRLPKHPGRGGRNQSLALAAAVRLDGESGVALLAAGTDGSDGPGQDAGAMVDGGTVGRGRVAGLDPHVALENADAGSFLEASADLLYTGPTGTNVADLVLALKTTPGV